MNFTRRAELHTAIATIDHVFLQTDASTGKLARRKRWLPLDALRGLAIVLMIWVQYGGGQSQLPSFFISNYVFD